MTKAEGAKALRHFTDGFNKTYRTLDPKLNASYEAGALLAIDQAKVKSAHGMRPRGNPGYTPLTFKDTHFTVPEQAGWPKSFVADGLTNRKDPRTGALLRWFLVFSRDGIDEQWRAVHLATFKNNTAPQLKRDGKFAEAVPVSAASGLKVAPGKLSKTYADYLTTGRGGAFAPGADTDAWRRDRAKQANGVGSRIQVQDQPSDYPAFALRTEDGGALVFFSTYYHQQQTLSTGLTIHLPDRLRGVMQGPAKKTNRMAFTSVSGQAAKVPAEDAGGRIEILNRLDAITSAKPL
ncbi:hypothetical protein [Streptomyces sp. NPDC048650]|uniref:hypothetical protein n=1 Tax=Streptomyces sp. NPDC048650 TaxID=3365583 RepID=UPI003713E9A5